MGGPTIEAAKEMHAQAGYRRYSGPKLQGERTVLKKGQAGYPEAFLSLADPPERLYLIGNPQALCDGLAVIGARKATPYGLDCAKRFAGRAAARGVVIVSGGALGCDSAAHRAALAAGGLTVVVLGGGCDEVYPASNHRLFQEVIDAGGAVVSERSWEYPPLRFAFRARNRLIAALAKATLIVEAGLPSGTFSTADEALAANREVLVVPGSICSVSSQGSNRLLYQGATPVVDDDSFDDIMFSLFGVLKQEEFRQEGPGGDQERPAALDDSLIEVLRANPLPLEELLPIVSAQVGADAAMTDLICRITELQRIGLIVRYPDGRFGPAKSTGRV